MELRERAWAELGVIERFAAVDQPREALARARRLEASLESVPELGELHAFARMRRLELEEDVKRWADEVRARHDSFIQHEHRKKR
jgi:hypothetical protein